MSFAVFTAEPLAHIGIATEAENLSGTGSGASVPQHDKVGSGPAIYHLPFTIYRPDGFSWRTYQAPENRLKYGTEPELEWLQ